MITLEEAKKMIGHVVIYNNDFVQEYGTITRVTSVFIFVKYKDEEISKATSPHHLFKCSNEQGKINSLKHLNILLSINKG